MATVPLLERQFLFVSGKGGVGRTTVATALAVLAARRGRRVLLAQMEAHERVAALRGQTQPLSPRVQALEANLWAVNMTAREALHEYGLMVLHYETLYRAVFENRAVKGFLSAVPGLDAYAMLGKAWWHTTETPIGGAAGTRKYDLVIVDGPASGHTSTLLRVPRAIVDAMPKGPLARDAQAMLSLMSDPARAAFVVVTLAEELPARETLNLLATVRGELRLPLGPLIVNAIPSATLAAASLHSTVDVALASDDPGLHATAAGVRALMARRDDADRVLERLRAESGLPCVTLPRFPLTRLGRMEVDALADHLAQSDL